MRPAANPIIECKNFLRDAGTAVRRVFRQDFSQPGFAVWVLPDFMHSQALRRCMVALKEHLSQRHLDQWGEPLEYLSMGRFDQQNSTRLHLDGGPERSFLMLGYEPTTVRSELHIADFSRCAHDLGLSPAGFLHQHNPMFSGGAELLKDYVTTLRDWQEDRPRIVIINNSIADSNKRWETYGVLHGATILAPDPEATRVINSTMIAPVCFVTGDPAMQVREFVSTDRISGQILE